MSYRIYYKCYCDVPGCEGKASDSDTIQGSFGFIPSRGKRECKNGDVVPSFGWRPGVDIPKPHMPAGWRFEMAGIFGLWVCPKHEIELKISGQTVKDILEDRDTYFKLRGQE